ncbi:MAG: CbtB-domain containing protein [Rhodobacter sp.]|nr:CbtB-domain containing protein [Rhodobacter sp.]MCY4167823.1 CbtB-domain containing protein [Rhodobacter sp.]MCY4243628.1 CbtB-domain containing protein [Rhodobacter sp.]
MNVQTPVIGQAESGTVGIARAIPAGNFLLAVSGFARAMVPHDTAHDHRHAMAFPRH